LKPWKAVDIWRCQTFPFSIFKSFAKNSIKLSPFTYMLCVLLVLHLLWDLLCTHKISFMYSWDYDIHISSYEIIHVRPLCMICKWPDLWTHCHKNKTYHFDECHCTSWCVFHMILCCGVSLGEKTRTSTKNLLRYLCNIFYILLHQQTRWGCTLFHRPGCWWINWTTLDPVLTPGGHR